MLRCCGSALTAQANTTRKPATLAAPFCSARSGVSLAFQSVCLFRVQEKNCSVDKDTQLINKKFFLESKEHKAAIQQRKTNCDQKPSLIHTGLHVLPCAKHFNPLSRSLILLLQFFGNTFCGVVLKKKRVLLAEPWKTCSMNSSFNARMAVQCPSMHTERILGTCVERKVCETCVPMLLTEGKEIRLQCCQHAQGWAGFARLWDSTLTLDEKKRPIPNRFLARELSNGTGLYFTAGQSRTAELMTQTSRPTFFQYNSEKMRGFWDSNFCLWQWLAPADFPRCFHEMAKEWHGALLMQDREDGESRQQIECIQTGQLSGPRVKLLKTMSDPWPSYPVHKRVTQNTECVFDKTQKALNSSFQLPTSGCRAGLTGSTDPAGCIRSRQTKSCTWNEAGSSPDIGQQTPTCIFGHVWIVYSEGAMSGFLAYHVLFNWWWYQEMTGTNLRKRAENTIALEGCSGLGGRSGSVRCRSAVKLSSDLETSRKSTGIPKSHATLCTYMYVRESDNLWQQIGQMNKRDWGLCFFDADALTL